MTTKAKPERRPTPGRPPLEGGRATGSFVLLQDQVDWIADEARREGIPKSRFVRALTDETIKHWERYGRPNLAGRQPLEGARETAAYALSQIQADWIHEQANLATVSKSRLAVEMIDDAMKRAARRAAKQ